jgi:hypothetical protein
LGARAAQSALDGAELDRHDLGRFVVTQTLHVTEDDGEPLVGGQTVDRLLNVASGFGAQALLFRPQGRVGNALGGAAFVLGIGRAERIEAFGWAALPTTELVITGVHGDAQQPGPQARRRPIERLQAAKGTQQCVLGRIGRVLSIAQSPQADVEQLPLVGLDQDVECCDVTSAGGRQRVFDRARLRLHSSMLPSAPLEYGYRDVHLLRWLPSALLLLPWLAAPLVPANEARLRDLAAPSSFHLLDWETVHLGERIGRLWDGVMSDSSASSAPSDSNTLRRYFGARARQPELRSDAEVAMERVVARAYRDAGVSQSEPLAVKGLFPPVLVALTAPPNVLVVSPRTELRVIDSSVLQSMEVAAQERLEASADSTGVSALVAPIGGLATYPSMVLEEDSPARVLSAVAHEWMHQYLIFYPLGAGYWNNQETREINETTADMIGQEVGSQLASSLGLAPPARQPAPASTSGSSAFDFRAFMRDTRGQTEQLLAAGQVDAAEAYMRSRRDELQGHGYYIRKLNQAYFALYGSYGEGFAASPANPIAGLLHTLRDRSPTLGEFIFRVRGITSVAQLRSAAAG